MDKMEDLKGILKGWLYKLVKKIGEGGYGAVYLCTNTRTKEKVAIKVMSISSPSMGYPSQLLREISILRELRHANIVRLLEVKCRVGTVYLVFEYLEHDLFDFLKLETKVRRSVVAQGIMKQILTGLAYCHSQKIIHRDLKLENILVDPEKDAVKIADFGLARSFRHLVRDLSARQTPYNHQSPEELLGNFTGYTTAVDLWAVGRMFSEILTGERLFVERNRVAQLTAIFELLGKPTDRTWPGVSAIGDLLSEIPNVDPIGLNQLHPGLDKTGIELLSGLLCLDPRRRVTAAEALKMDYLRYVQHVSLAVRPSTGFRIFLPRCLAPTPKFPK